MTNSVMTYNELITAAISIVALCVSIVALRRSNPQNTLAKIELEKEKYRKIKTNLSISIVKKENRTSYNKESFPSYYFSIKNEGEVLAENCYFEIYSPEDFISTKDYDSKMNSDIHPGSVIDVKSNILHHTRRCEVVGCVFWTNPDRTKGCKEFSLTW